GLVQEVQDLPVNHRIWVVEGEAPSRIEPFTSKGVANQLPARQSSATAHDTTEAAPFRPTAKDVPCTFETWLLPPIATPALPLADLDGGGHNLTSLRGHPVLLHLWVMQSPGCQEDLSLLSRNHAKWAAQGLRLMSVSVDEAKVEDVAAFVRERRL